MKINMESSGQKTGILVAKEIPGDLFAMCFRGVLGVALQGCGLRVETYSTLQ